MSNGKVPVSAKKQAQSADFMNSELNVLMIDPTLRQELEEQNLVYRWINAKQYLSGGNFHKSGWVAYRPKSTAGSGNTDFLFGRSADGYIIRHDLLLAVRPKEANTAHKRRLQNRVDAQTGLKSTRAQQLREQAQEAGIKMRIHDGYEENGGTDADDE